MQKIQLKDIQVGDTVRMQYRCHDCTSAHEGLVTAKGADSITIGAMRLYTTITADYYIISRAITVPEIQARLAKIADLASEREHDGAHSMEDALFVDVLTAISNGVDNAKELAAAALESRKLDFKRYTS